MRFLSARVFQPLFQRPFFLYPFFALTGLTLGGGAAVIWLK
jgi:demethoxyubiquinone hydroxylase (CLK1/Coq7/Cat5 family)